MVQKVIKHSDFLKLPFVLLNFVGFKLLDSKGTKTVQSMLWAVYRTILIASFLSMATFSVMTIVEDIKNIKTVGQVLTQTIVCVLASAKAFQMYNAVNMKLVPKRMKPKNLESYSSNGYQLLTGCF